MNPEIILYNRIPKTGSGPLKQLIEILSEKNKFHFDGGNGFEKHHIDEEQQVRN